MPRRFHGDGATLILAGRARGLPTSRYRLPVRLNKLIGRRHPLPCFRAAERHEAHTGLPRPFAHDDAGDTRRGRERQQARKEQHHQRAGEQADSEGDDKPPILPIALPRAGDVRRKIAAGALEVGRLPLELLRGGAYQCLAAALEQRRIVLRALPENGVVCGRGRNPPLSREHAFPNS